MAIDFILANGWFKDKKGKSFLADFMLMKIPEDISGEKALKMVMKGNAQVLPDDGTLLKRWKLLKQEAEGEIED